MTSFRGRPAGARARTLDDRDRRSMLLNLGFGITIVVAIAILGIAFLATWYDQHLAAAATVNGQSISKDDYQRQLKINSFRTDYEARKVRTLLTAGRIRSADATARLGVLDQRSQQANTITLEQLIDGRIMADLAAQQGVEVTDADVDARLLEEATTPEMRHAWMIAVQPQAPAGKSAPDDAAKAAAKAAATKALADLRAGKTWEEVARAVSTDASKDQAGDLGYVDKNAELDPAFVAALMAAGKDAPTDVVEGADGVYRVGRVTEVIAPVVDGTLESQVTAEGIAMSDFRDAIRRDVTRTNLSKAVTAQYLARGPQREVAEIFMGESQSESAAGAIKARHILYSPKDDPQGASQVPADDPAWKEAEAAARAAYEKVKADPSQFDAIARAESDESAARQSGGKLPYFSPEDQIDKAFADAIFKPGLQPGQLLEPVKSGFGWHVIQIMHGPTDLEWAKKLKADIESGKLTFADAARDNSDNADAAKGGDLGWVAKGQLDDKLEQAIFAAPIGKVAEPLVVAGDGLHMYLVSKEETRDVDAAQKATIESSAFTRWYDQHKQDFTVTRDPGVTGEPGS